MSKTIEEAAKEAARKEYLCERCAWKSDCDHCGGQNTAFDCCECPADSYEDGFKAGANHVYGLPLTSRLTADEKERVRKMYKEAVEGKCELEKMQPQNTYAKNSIAMRIGVNMGCILTFESIFGKDFLKEGE